MSTGTKILYGERINKLTSQGDYLSAPAWRVLILALSLLVLAGCSVKVIYNQLDWLIPWYLDDYVTLDDDQEQEFDSVLAAYLQWHRYEQLPIYAEFLNWLATAGEDGLSEAEIAQMLRQTEGFADALFSRLGPALADILSSLSDAQLLEMNQRFAEENETYREKYILEEPSEQRDRRARKTTKFIQRWTGTLTDEQLKLIDQWSQDYLLMGEEFLQSRLGWQLRLQALLQKRDQGEEFLQSLTRLFDNRRIGRSEAFTEKFSYNQQLLTKLYLDLDRLLSSEQRQRLIGKIRDYAQDLRELSQQAGS